MRKGIRKVAVQRSHPRDKGFRFRFSPVQWVKDYINWVKPAFMPLPYPEGVSPPDWYTKKYTLRNMMKAAPLAIKIYRRSWVDPEVVDHMILDDEELKKYKSKLKKEELREKMSTRRKFEGIEALNVEKYVGKKEIEKGAEYTNTLLEVFKDALTNLVEGYREGRDETLKKLDLPMPGSSNRKHKTEHQSKLKKRLGSRRKAKT